MMMAATRAGSTSALKSCSSACSDCSTRDPVVGHREGHVIDLRQHRPEACLVRLHFAGEADAGERAAVEAAGEGDDRGALRMEARNLDRVLDRLGAGAEEDRFLGRLARRQLVELLRERDVAFVGRDLEAGVHEAVELARDALPSLCGCTWPVLSTAMPLAKSM